MINYLHFALRKSFLVLYSINFYVSSIILIKIMLSEPVWIKREGMLVKPNVTGVLCGNIKQTHYIKGTVSLF